MNKPMLLPSSGPSILACGAWLKNTVCVTRGNEAHVSQLIGDLDSAEARTMLDATVARLCKELDVQPEIVAHDLHPDFYSTRFAQTYAAQRGLPVVAVQHHHAHIAAICAEHHINDAVLGLALDGVGLGTDNTPWGGELLRVDGAGFERLGHLAPLHLPGGDRAAREPWRMAAAVLFQLGRGEEIAQRFSGQPGAQTVAAMLQRNLNCPITSSTGRLFDAAAGLLGVSEIQSFEAQAAIQLQELAQHHGQVAPLEMVIESMKAACSTFRRCLRYWPKVATLPMARRCSMPRSLRVWPSGWNVPPTSKIFRTSRWVAAVSTMTFCCAPFPTGLQRKGCGC